MKNNKEIVCAEDYWPLIPDGVYTVQCTNHDAKFILGKSRKIFLNFEIVDPGEFHGLKLFMAFNLPYDKKIRTGSKYYKNWVMVNGWKQPSRNAQMSPKLFQNKIYKVKTRVSKPKLNKKEMPENFWYSVVDEIVEVIVGGTLT